MKKNICLILQLILVLSNYQFAQEVKVGYKDINPPIFASNEKITLGFLHFAGVDSLENKIYDKLFAQREIHSKFLMFPFKILESQKSMLKLKELLPLDEKVFKALKEKLDIDFILTGNSVSDSEFTLQLYSTSEKKLILEHSYLNSLTSSALDDAIKLFMENKIPEYLIKSTLELVVNPSDAIVKLDGVTYTSQRFFKLDPGEYNLIIELDGYNSRIERIKIPSKEYVKKEFNLVQILGSLELKPEHKNAVIKLLRKGKEVYSGVGDTLLLDMPAGKYMVECALEGYDTLVMEIRIPDYERLSQYLPLKRSVKELFKIREIKFDGKYINYAVIEIYQDSILIIYELTGDRNNKFDVQIQLRNRNNPNKKYYMREISGAVGKDILGGGRREIIWNMKKDFPLHGLGEGDFVFELIVD